MTSKSFENEFIEIYDFNGQKTGEKALKSVAHKNGFHHSTVHLWIYTISGEVLIQKRSLNKILNPGVWDVSVAGHIGAGEKTIAAAIRETAEEIGIQISAEDLTQIGYRKDEIRHPNGILDNEFKHIFLCKLHKELHELTRQVGEVDALALFDISILKDASKHGNFMVPNMNQYYDFIHEKLQVFLH